MAHTLTHTQLQKLEIIERVASCLSLAGTLFVFFTFVYSPTFRRPVNRLIFYASWGNILCNIATLISQSGIRAGRDSRLCQFQAFLIQMCLVADALWNAALAINVYLTVFRKYNAERLKLIEWKYHVICYGLPFLVAFIYLFIHTPSRGHIYGPANLWCWIDINWVTLRILLCYAPAWMSIIVSFWIYLLAGREIFAKRKQLRAFKRQRRQTHAIENPLTDFKITEVNITSESVDDCSPKIPESPTPLDRRSSPKASVSPISLSGLGQYSVSIGSVPKSMPPSDSIIGMRANPATSKTAIQHRTNQAALEANAAAWGYTRVALLFFVSLLVTWVPSSINRVYSLAHPDRVSIPFTYASSVVLPLMGAWNSVVYITTSWHAVRQLLTGNLQPEDIERPLRRLSAHELPPGQRGDNELEGLKRLARGQGYKFHENGYRLA